MKLSEKTIKEIADNLDCGLICFIHKETGDVKSVINPDDPYAEEEHWKEDMDEIEKEIDKYYRIDKMSSREAFRVMEDFTEEVPNQDIKKRLIYALNRNKPFQNFKYEVDYDEDVRQQWFKFKAHKYEEWVKNCLEYINEEEDD